MEEIIVVLSRKLKRHQEPRSRMSFDLLTQSFQVYFGACQFMSLQSFAQVVSLTALFNLACNQHDRPLGRRQFDCQHVASSDPLP